MNKTTRTRTIIGLASGVMLAGSYALAQIQGGMGHSMARPDTSGIARGAPLVDVAAPETLPGLAATGKQIFDQACAACHGANAAGRNGMGPPLVHPFYVPGHHGDAAILSAARNGVQAHHWTFGNMPPVRDLTDGDIKMVIAYIRTVQRANGIK